MSTTPSRRLRNDALASQTVSTYITNIMLTVTPTKKWGAEIYTRRGPAGTFRGNCSATHPEPTLTRKINTSMRIMRLDEKILHPITIQFLNARDRHQLVVFTIDTRILHSIYFSISSMKARRNVCLFNATCEYAICEYADMRYGNMRYAICEYAICNMRICVANMR